MKTLGNTEIDFEKIQNRSIPNVNFVEKCQFFLEFTSKTQRYNMIQFQPQYKRQENLMRLDIRITTRTMKMVPGSKQGQKGQRPPT